MTQHPPTFPTYADGTPRGYLKPHRGTAVLVLGILGLAVCVICGIIAWSMGNSDLREMGEGNMDPSGREVTQAGKICGMISVILNLVAIGIWVLLIVLGVATGSFTAGA